MDRLLNTNDRRRRDERRFVRYKEGSELYGMSQNKFEDLAKDAKAVYKVGKMVLVNCPSSRTTWNRSAYTIEDFARHGNVALVCKDALRHDYIESW